MSKKNDFLFMTLCFVWIYVVIIYGFGYLLNDIASVFGFLFTFEFAVLVGHFLSGKKFEKYLLIPATIRVVPEWVKSFWAFMKENKT